MKCEYQIVTRQSDAPLSKADLNTVGADEWQLVSAIVCDLTVIYYFIRTIGTGSSPTLGIALKQ